MSHWVRAVKAAPVKRTSRVLLSQIAALLLLSPMLGVEIAHSHPLGPNGDGRIPGRADFERKGDTTYRYVPDREEYEVRSPGRPVGYMHRDPAATLNAGHKAESGTAAAKGSLQTLPTAELAPICRTAGNRIIILYLGPDPIPTSTLRSIVRRMNWKIADQSSLSSGGNRVVKMAVDCDSAGNINIYRGSATSTMGPGYSDWEVGADAVKRLTFQAGAAEIGGSATIFVDGIKSRQNAAASHVANGFVEGNPSWEKGTPIHELFHTLGAVRSKVAPYATEGSHCVDGLDIMCYEDGWGSPWGKYAETYCPASLGYETPVGVPIDCHNDSYFDAAPTPGTYLAEHWNLAGPEDPFLTIMPSKAPKATTDTASPLEPGKATLNATITPESEFAYHRFEYTTDADYQTNGWANAQSPFSPKRGVLGFGSTPSKISYKVSGLSPYVTYRYRVIASNDANETVYGSAQSFTVPPYPPKTGGVSEVHAQRAVLNGEVNPNGETTKYFFQWRPVGQGWFWQAPINTPSAGSGNAYVPVSLKVGDPKMEGEEYEELKPATTYEYRLTTSDGHGYHQAAVNSFTTPKWKPEAVIKAATGTTSTRTTLNATVNPNGLATTYQFEYGPSGSGFTTKAPASPQGIGAGGNDVSVSAQVSGLSPQSTYFFRVVATNVEGTTYSGSRSLFTGPTIEAESEQANVTGSQDVQHAITLSGGKIKCNVLELKGTHWLSETDLSLTETMSGCTAFGVKATVIGNLSCQLHLHILNSGPPYAVNEDFVCGEGGITFDAPSLPCAVTVAPRSGFKGISLSNSGSGSERAITVAYNLSGLKYTQTGAGCPEGAGSYSNGVYTGTTTLRAVNPKDGKAVGLYLTGEASQGLFLSGKESTENALQPRLEAESFPATLVSNVGTANKLVTGTSGSNISCTALALKDATPAPVADVSLEVTSSKCTMAGVKATMSVNSCSFNLHVLNAGPPYAASEDIACSKGGDVISFDAPSLPCTVKVPAQSGLKGIELANAGTGTERAVSVTYALSGITYTLEGVGCFAKGTFSNGSYTGTATISALK